MSKHATFSDVVPAPFTVSEYAPARIIRMDLAEPCSGISAFDEKSGFWYRRALCFVYLHTQPLGAVEFVFDEQGVDAQTCLQKIGQRLHAQINEHLRQDGLPAMCVLDVRGIVSEGTPACLVEQECFLARAPFVSVIVPTHDRPDDLKFCLPSLLNLHYPRYEVIIVDNAPASSATADLIQQTYRDRPRLRYVREDRPGVSWARNAGSAFARGEIIAFTDDDVEVDPGWLMSLVRGFSLAENVGCVTGQVQPLELATPAQYWCEENAGQCWFHEDSDPLKRFTQRIFTQSGRHRHLYRIGLFGCGANMAFRPEVLQRIQGFDPALGGTGPSRCGQDVAAFFATMMQGYTIAYEPKALVYHQHRRSYAALQKQFYNYGVGLTAYLTRNIYEYPQVLLDLFTKVPYDLLIDRSTTLNKTTERYPKDLKKVALRGMLYGPLAFVLSRRSARKAGMYYPPFWRRSGRSTRVSTR
jgi:GT2 family glycosyltransferase